MMPLRVAIAIALLLVAGLAWWTWRSTSPVSADGRTSIVFWGSSALLGEDIYAVLNRFEQENPAYHVVLGSAVAPDLTGDAQRLLSAIVGGVPPDVVWFDRMMIGEWAGRGALEDLTPYLERQAPGPIDPIRVGDYYPFAINEVTYRRPGDAGPGRIYGIPTNADIRVLFSNGDLLRQEGMVDEHGEPKPPATWDELRAAAVKLSRFRDPNDRRRGLERLGFAPNYGNSWLYLYAWQAGGEFLSPDRRTVTLATPPVARALGFMTSIYDDLGGVAQVNGFQEGFQAGALDPFLRGQVAMKIDGSWSLDSIADWRPDMDVVISPAPMPADELAKGRKPLSWAGGWSLVMPATATQKEGAFKLIQFLSSWRACELLEQGKRERKHSEGRLYLPMISANRVFDERLSRTAVRDNPAIPPRIRHAYDVYAGLLPETRIRPVSPVGQVLWSQHVRAYEAAVNHSFAAQAKATGTDEPTLALAAMQGDVQQRLDAVLAPPPSTAVDWRPFAWLYVGVVALVLAAIAVAYRVQRRRRSYRAGEVWASLLFASPWMIGFAVFVGGPVLFSIVCSFTSYDVLSPARYLGLANYREVFGDPVFYRSLANTAVMIIRIPLTMAASLAIALLLNRGIRGIGFYRTAFYLPSVMPLVAASLLWVWLFNPSYGAINQILHLFTTDTPAWLQDPDWSKPSLILMNLWGAGGGMIIWLAGLQAIPQHLYEAARIDGANAWQRFRHVTIPMLSPYILFNLIMGLIGTMQVFGEAYIMTAGGPVDSTLFYAYFLFKEAFQFFRMGYASALAWILFVIILLLTLVQMRLSRKWVHYDHV